MKPYIIVVFALVFAQWSLFVRPQLPFWKNVTVVPVIDWICTMHASYSAIFASVVGSTGFDIEVVSTVESTTTSFAAKPAAVSTVMLVGAPVLVTTACFAGFGSA